MRSVGVAVFALVLLLAPGIALADNSILGTQIGQLFLAQGTLTNGCFGGLCPGAYADIFATPVVGPFTSVTFEFEGLTQSSGGHVYQYIFGGAGDSTNLVGLVLTTTTGVTATGISATTVFDTGAPGALSAILGGSDTCTGTGVVGQHVDGVGCYNLTINATAGGTPNAVDDIIFTLNNPSGWDCLKSTQCSNSVLTVTGVNVQSWTDSRTGLPIDSPSWAEGHLSVCSPPVGTTYPVSHTLSGQCGNGNTTPTAWAGGAATPTPVPEPATLALLGSGLVGMGFARRRKWLSRRAK